MVNGKRRRIRALNLPKGRASALPKGSVIRSGLRGKKPLAERIVKQARFSQRTGIAPSTFGQARKRLSPRRGVEGRILGFRMDGKLP